MKEEWRKITGFEKYSVSNTGLIRNNITKRLIGQQFWRGGGRTTPYAVVALTKQGKSKLKRVNRLVAEAFLGDIAGKIVDHINRDSLNNNVTNLRIVTNSQNNLNCRAYVGKKVKYKGVTMYGKRFAASFWKNKKQTFQSFDTPEEAARWYDQMAPTILGQHATTNASLGLLSAVANGS